MVSEDSEEIYQGFCIDLLEKLREILGFSYRIRLVEDGQFGGQNEDGSWNGLIGELVSHVSNSKTYLYIVICTNML